MPLPDPPAGGPGGMLELEYASPGAGERHALKLHVCNFDQSPSGVDNDYSYVATGPVVPAETSVLQTFAAVAALWAGYFPSSWELRLIGLRWAVTDGFQILPETPVAVPIPGTAVAPPLGYAAVDRIFHLRSVQHVRRQLWLQQIADLTIDDDVEVSDSGGGFDARDRALMNYLAGNTGGGVVAVDGHRFEAVAQLRRWWARRLEPVATGGEGGGTGLTGDCLVYPLGAELCNASGNVVTLDTPGGHFVFDATGITLPGGHRLESFLP